MAEALSLQQVGLEIKARISPSFNPEVSSIMNQKGFENLK